MAIPNTKRKAITKKVNLIRQLAGKDLDRFIQQHFLIPDLLGRTVPLKYNWTQQRITEDWNESMQKGEMVRRFYLKSRRVGSTSVVAARVFAEVWANDNKRGAILAHDENRSKEILERMKFYYSSLPVPLQLIFDRNTQNGFKFYETHASMLVGTAENPEKVRGDGIHILIGSECSYWGNRFGKVMREIGPIVPAAAGTTVILETTGKMRGSPAHQFWEESKLGNTGYKATFLDWLKDPTAVIPFRSDYERDSFLARTTESFKPFMEKNRWYKLTPEQIHWAYGQLINAAFGDTEYFWQEFPYDEDEAWRNPTTSYFGETDLQSLKADPDCQYFTWADRAINAPFQSFADLKCVKMVDENGSAPFLKIWNGPNPNAQYIIGSDLSEGESSSGDFSAGYIIDMVTREMMGAFHGRVRMDEHAHILTSLARIYNNALVAPEVNLGGYGIMTYLPKFYQNIYNFKWMDSQKLRKTNRIGWFTTGTTRPQMLAELKRMVVDAARGSFVNCGLFKDKYLLKEMGSFAFNPNTYRPEAMPGAKDDRVMALAICHLVASQETYGGTMDLYSNYARMASPLNTTELYQKNMADESATDSLSRIMNTEKAFELQGDKLSWQENQLVDLGNPYS
jgi:hypothetical protein